MRFDAYVFNCGLYPSRTKAAEAIARGEVLLDGKTVVKPAFTVTGEEKVEKCQADYVSLGGYKLERAFETFPISADGKIFVDVGASTGGFTQCLLSRGARKIYAVDVGESLLSYEIRKDPRVIPVENFNARNLSPEALGEKTDGAVCDVSFISLTYVLKPIFDVLKEGGFAVVLIKPQFECGRDGLNKHGVVTDGKKRKNAVDKIVSFSRSVGFFIGGITEAPLRQGKNVEYLLFLKKESVSVESF